MPINKLFVGLEASMSAAISEELVRNFVTISGDDAPLHTDDAYAKARGFDRTLVHGALLVAMLSRFVGTVLPGPSSLWVKCEISFHLPCYAPCELAFRGTISQISEATEIACISTAITDNQSGKIALARTMHKVF
jgi:acyl dehydratase